MNKPHFHFVTLFPETIDVWLRTSIIGRAFEKGLFTFSLYQLRDYSENKHKTVDDTAYGGGGGMVLKVEPLVKVTEAIQERLGKSSCRVIYFSPAGKPINHQLVMSYASQTEFHHLILICGHYEGVDQRFIDGWVDEELSLGDFVVSGGELPALAFTDAVIRQLDGTVQHLNGALNESFHLQQDSGSTLLEYAHYTRPPQFRDFEVPPVLLQGDHQSIAEWRMESAKARTLHKRPDLLNQ